MSSKWLWSGWAVQIAVRLYGSRECPHPHRACFGEFEKALAIVAINHNENPIGFGHTHKIVFQPNDCREWAISLIGQIDCPTSVVPTRL